MLSYLKLPEPFWFRYITRRNTGPLPMRNIILSIMLLSGIACLPALAQDFYSGEVSVADQGVAERQSAAPAALIQVLQKHSGQREIPLHPALDSALLNANRILVSFFYKQVKRSSPDGSVTDELRMVANFLPEAVDNIVREIGLPRWPQQRRPVTLWLVVDDGLGRRLKPLEYEYAWDAMIDVAKLRGLPIRWPEIDPDAEDQVDLQLLWGGFTDDLGAGDEAVGDVVIVAARREGPVWNVRWNFAGGQETDGWRIRDSDLAFAVVDGVHRLADLVASRDAIGVTGQGNWTLELRVGGMTGSADYVRARGYLENLSVIEAVNVVEAGPAGVLFRLDLNAAPEYLAREIAKNRFLLPVDEGKAYQLLPENSFDPTTAEVLP